MLSNASNVKDFSCFSNRIGLFSNIEIFGGHKQIFLYENTKKKHTKNKVNGS